MKDRALSSETAQDVGESAVGLPEKAHRIVFQENSKRAQEVKDVLLLHGG
jgi:hypothetical protein